MTRYTAPILATLLFTACQSINNGPIVAGNLPDPREASGQPRFPVPVDTVADNEVVTFDEVVAVLTPGAMNTSGDCTADAMSPGAVGNPCATTRSFMESLGMNDNQIAAVIAAGQDMASLAH